MCRSIAAVLLGWIALLITTPTSADELTRRTNSRGNIADQLNHQQLSKPAVSPNPVILKLPTESIGILFLRGDGGDPKALRLDADDTLIFVVQRNGEGRAYQNGRQVDIDPAVKESATQIAVMQFGAPARTQVMQSALSASAQAALGGFAENGVKPDVMFTHTVTREDTARVSDQRATKIMAMEGADSTTPLDDMVELVRMAMRMFALKSDACDNSLDPRCNRPGVREAFAQIKREEGFQSASASR